MEGRNREVVGRAALTDDGPRKEGSRETTGRTLDHMAFERIVVDPARMGGLPTIRETRVTAGMVLGQLAAGRTIDDVLADYPYLERDDVLATLEYAAAAVNQREVPVARPA